jgi:hypothetical protein
LFYTTPTDDGAIAVTCDRCLQSVDCPDPVGGQRHYSSLLPARHRHGWSRGRRPQSRSPAAGAAPARRLVGRLLPGVWVPAGQRPKPGPLRTPSDPQPLPSLPRGPLMPRITIHAVGREPLALGHPADDALGRPADQAQAISWVARGQRSTLPGPTT